ncbi:MAG: DUF1707 domain-containing protein [Solirubrobacterales bacterium]|nr:DUF1707 domain-containing protein [Solirubrobacterales bacterium]
MATCVRRAMVEGRLSADELEERLEALYAARTYGELGALVADLPVSHSRGRPRPRVVRWVGAVGALMLVLAVLGRLAVVRVHSTTAAIGSGHIGQLRVRSPLPDPHQGLIMAASTAGVLAVVLACAALVLVLVRSRSTSNA